MAKYTFDENGDTFNYFVLTTLAIILIPATYLIVFKKTAVAARKVTCPCDACQRKASRAVAPRKSSGVGKKVAILLGWVLFGFVAYQAYITPSPEVNKWNPFDILGIDDSATPKQIKSAYRGLSKIWHPDKVKSAIREKADAMMSEINKAYETLTDDATRENWEKYGHPDGSRNSMTMSIALPAWIVEAHNNFWVLSAYGIVCGLMLPYFIGKWWYRSGNYTKDRIRTKTMGTFFKQLKETTSAKEIVEILSRAEEFKEDIVSRPSDETALEKLAVKVDTALESKNGEKFEYTKKTTSPASLKVLTLLYAHTLKVPVEDKDLAQDQVDIVSKTLHLINGMIQITTARQWLSVSLSLMDMSQILVQGLYFHDSPLQQLPYVNINAVKALKGDNQIKTISQFMEMDREDRVALLKDNVTADQVDQVATVAKQYPVLKVRKAFFKVAGDNIITPGSLCTFILKVRAVFPGETVEEEVSAKSAKDNVDALFEGDVDSEEDEDGNVKPKKASKATAPTIHAPYFPGDKKPFWWVVLGDHKNNRIVVAPTKITDVTSTSKTVRIQFQSPPRPGQYSFNLFIKSDSIVGSDIQQDMTLTVLDASQLPPEPEAADDISEPDEDSLAGQMALLKEQGLAAAAIGGGGNKPTASAKGKGKAPQTDSDTDSESD